MASENVVTLSDDNFSDTIGADGEPVLVASGLIGAAHVKQSPQFSMKSLTNRSATSRSRSSTSTTRLTPHVSTK